MTANSDTFVPTEKVPGEESDTEEWSVTGRASVANVELGEFVYVEVENVVGELTTDVYMMPVRSDKVEVDITVRSVDDDKAKLGAITEFAPEEAERLAQNLLVCAHEARENGGA